MHGDHERAQAEDAACYQGVVQLDLRPQRGVDGLAGDEGGDFVVLVYGAQGVDAEDREDDYPGCLVSVVVDASWMGMGPHGSRKKNANHSATFRRRYM